MTFPPIRTPQDVENELLQAVQLRAAVALEAEAVAARLKASDERVLGLRRELAALLGERAQALPELVMRALVACRGSHQLALQEIADAVGSSRAHVAVTVNRARGRPFFIEGKHWRIAATNPRRGVVKVEVVTDEKLVSETAAKARRSNRELALEARRRRRAKKRALEAEQKQKKAKAKKKTNGKKQKSKQVIKPRK